MFVACDDDDTYADMLKRERKQISAFLTSGVTVMGTDGTPVLEVPGNIQVISEEQFYAQDSLTDVSRNEYVLFSGSGVYMQIIRKGQGKPLADGEHATVLSRYIEYNIASDTIQTSNRNQFYVPYPETMSCTNSGGLFTGTFTSGAMLNTYGTASVPRVGSFPWPSSTSRVSTATKARRWFASSSPRLRVRAMLRTTSIPVSTKSLICAAATDRWGLTAG